MRSATADPAAQIREVAAAFVDEALFCTGLQVSVRTRDGQSVDVSVSNGSEVDVATVFSVYCATRPVVAMVALHLVDAGLVDLDAPLGPHFDAGHPFALLSYSLRDVMEHRGQLAVPSVTDVLTAPMSQRADLIIAGLSRGAPGYSNYLGQIVLAELVRTLCGEHARRTLDKTVVGPLGLRSDLIFEFTPERLAAEFDRIGPYATKLGRRGRSLVTV